MGAAARVLAAGVAAALVVAVALAQPATAAPAARARATAGTARVATLHARCLMGATVRRAPPARPGAAGGGAQQRIRCDANESSVTSFTLGKGTSRRPGNLTDFDRVQ